MNFPIELARASHIVLVSVLGAEQIMATEVYLELPYEAVANTTARALTRREMIALREVERRRRVA